MKKVLSIVLAVVMLLTMSVMAFAADKTITGNASSEPQSDNTVVVKTSTTDENGDDATSFTVSYPAETTIPWAKNDAVPVAYAVTTQLMFNKRLSVKVTNDGANTMKGSTGNDQPLAYTLDGDVDIKTTAAVVTLPEGQTTNYAATVTVADAAWAAAPVDTYQDTLTFTVSVVDA